jgi:cobalamin biosynthesis protein CbiG
MDSSGKFIINLLGGSDERTGRLISELAKIIGGEAVITGFSQESILPSLGWIAEQKGWKMHPKSQPYALMAALGSHQPVALIKDDELNLPVSIRGFSWPAVFSDWQMAATSGYSNAVVLTCRNIDELLWQNFENVLVYFLPVLVAGVNLVRGISAERVIKTVKDTLLRFNLAPESLVCLATAEDLRDEPGLLEAVSVIECAFRTFSRERINQTKNRTDFLAGGQRYLNRGGVANAVALLASGSDTLLVENQKFKGITVAVAMVKPSTVEAYSDK